MHRMWMAAIVVAIAALVAGCGSSATSRTSTKANSGTPAARARFDAKPGNGAQLAKAASTICDTFQREGEPIAIAAAKSGLEEYEMAKTFGRRAVAIDGQRVDELASVSPPKELASAYQRYVATERLRHALTMRELAAALARADRTQIRSESAAAAHRAIASARALEIEDCPR